MLSAKTVPITSTNSKTDVVRVRPSSTSGVPVDTGPLGELAVTRGAEKIKEIYTEGARPSASAGAPGLTRANLRRLEGKDPVAAALASVVSSMPPSETSPTPGIEVANAKVKAWRTVARKGKGKEAPLGTMFGATWAEETFEIPHGEMDWSLLAQSSDREPDWVSGEPTPPEKPKEYECLKPGPSPRALAPEHTSVDRGLPPSMAAPKLGLDETMELLSWVLGEGDENLDPSALSAALKTKLGLSDLKKPPPTMSPRVELLTRDVKSCRGIRSSPIDSSLSPFHRHVRTVPICSVGDTTEAEMKGYGLSALAPWATVHPSPLSGGTRDTGVPGRGTKAIATANLQIELPEFDPQKLSEWAEESSEFLLLTGQQHADVRPKCTLIKKWCKKKFLQRQVKTAIRRSSNWGNFLKRLEQIYPVYKTDLSVRTELRSCPLSPGGVRRRGARVGNRGPPPRGGAGRPRRDPPPHPPHRPASRWGAGPHRPRQGGWSPLLPPERGAGARPSPPPQPPAPTGTAGNKRARANAPGRRTDRAPRRRASMNRSGMGTTPPMTRTTPVTPALLPAQGRQRDGTRQSDPPPYWPPRPHKRGARRTPPPPPQTHPPAHKRHGPAPRGAHSPKPGRGEPGPDRPPRSTPDGARDRGRTRGGARTAWNGPTSAQCRDRARCARHTRS